MIPALESRLASQGDAVGVMARLGAAYREAGRVEDARYALERALELDPDSDVSAYYLGLTYEDLERWADARDVYARLLAGDASEPVRDAVEGRLGRVRRLALEDAARRAVSGEAGLTAADLRQDAVAVFPFEYTGQDPQMAALGSALAALLTTDLAQSQRLTVLERVQLQALLDEMDLAESGRVAPGTAARSGRLLGAANVVVGQIGGEAGTAEIESLLLDAREEGDATPPLTETEAVERLIDAEKRLVLALFDRMGIQLTAAERERVNQRPTENVQALLAYGLAVEAEATGDLETAAAEYARAASLDVGFQAAAEGAERVEGIREAASTSTSMAALQGAATMFDGGTLDDWLVRREAFTSLESFIPTLAPRDPTEETLGVEGLVRTTTIRLILDLPGG